ncbi:MAG: Rne/Rng family ribonuclease [Candidatus Tectomicrobia bacterium]|nr:Rne/Rng family ribonuclease [Candidatus Tectomicrobia bacterium]
MGKLLLINARDEEESRVAVVENGVLEDIYTETASREQIKGNIYKGQIVKIEPSFQAAFVEYGGVRDGFLPIGDVHPKYYIRPGAALGPGGHPRIQEVLKRKQEVMVQVVKEAMGTKGAALTTHISLPGRYLVLMPHIGGATRVSRKIEDEAERKKLKEILTQLEPPKNMGFIVRTAGLGRTKTEITSDLNYLVKLWTTIETSAQEKTVPALVYKERDLIIRTIRDYFMPDIEQVLIDDKEVYRQTREFIKMVMPRYLRRVKLFSERQPIFSHHKIEPQIEAIYNKKVLLRSGGSIVIEPTEALVSIDVNSGRATRARGIEETALTTNLEAAVEAARQLRLRDLGGLVVIDFIDMYEAEHRSEVERVLRADLKKDKAKVQVSRISKFGLLELSRQRMRAAIQEGSYVTCQTCQGSGLVKSRESAALAILRQLQDAATTNTYQLIRGRISPEIASYLLNQKREDLNQIERDHGMTIILEGTPGLKDGEPQWEYVKQPPREEKKGKEAAAAEERLPKEQVEIAAARAEAVAGEAQESEALVTAVPAGEAREEAAAAEKRKRRSRGGRRRSRRRRGKGEAEEAAQGNGRAGLGPRAAGEPAAAEEAEKAEVAGGTNSGRTAAPSAAGRRPERPSAPRPRGRGEEGRGRERRPPRPGVQRPPRPVPAAPAQAKAEAPTKVAQQPARGATAAETRQVGLPGGAQVAAAAQQAPTTQPTGQRPVRPDRRVSAPFVIEATSVALPGEGGPKQRGATPPAEARPPLKPKAAAAPQPPTREAATADTPAAEQAPASDQATGAREKVAAARRPRRRPPRSRRASPPAAGEAPATAASRAPQAEEGAAGEGSAPKAAGRQGGEAAPAGSRGGAAARPRSPRRRSGRAAGIKKPDAAPSTPAASAPDQPPAAGAAPSGDA